MLQCNKLFIGISIMGIVLTESHIVTHATLPLFSTPHTANYDMLECTTHGFFFFQVFPFEGEGNQETTVSGWEVLSIKAVPLMLPFTGLLGR